MDKCYKTPALKMKRVEKTEDRLTSDEKRDELKARM